MIARPSTEGQKAMAGSLDADSRREQARVSLSPSCTWLSPLPRNRERQTQCLISIVMSSMGRAQAHPRNRQDRPPGRRRRHRHLWRDHGAGDRGRRQGAEGRHRFLPPDLQLPGEILRRRPHPGRLFQARGPPDRARDADLAPDRPPDPPAVRRRLSLRHPGDRALCSRTIWRTIPTSWRWSRPRPR